MVDRTLPKRNRDKGFWTTVLLLTVLSIVWLAWLANTPFSNFLPEAAKPADQIDALFKLLAGMGGTVLIYVLGCLIYFMVTFRQRDGEPEDAIGVQWHDAPKVEIAFWVVPTLMVIVISVYSLQIWLGLQTSPGNALTVEAIGRQFAYDFRYPTLWKPVSNEMHVPLGQPITVKITSSDVIHGFWVPEVRLKADMVPGLVNTLRFTPTRIGKYRIVCTEFCGILHGKMVGEFYVDAPGQFKQWLAMQAKAEGPAPSAAAAAVGKSQGGSAAVPLAQGDAVQGKALFATKCSVCHSLGTYDQRIAGPGLGHLLDDPAHPNLVTGETASAIAITHILKNGYSGTLGMMPNQTQNAISDSDIANVTAYLVSLSK